VSLGHPGASVEDAGDGGEQNVTPVEGGALVEVGESEETGREDERFRLAKARSEQVLQDAAEEEFFGDSS